HTCMTFEECSKNFDNLGYDNDFVKEWRNQIFLELKKNDFALSDLLGNTLKNNKDLVEYIVHDSKVYHLLNNKGLLNKGFCPITGDITNKGSYNSYGRYIYLSEKGIDTCESINRRDWDSQKNDYDNFQRLKSNGRVR